MFQEVNLEKLFSKSATAFKEKKSRRTQRLLQLAPLTRL